MTNNQQLEFSQEIIREAIRSQISPGLHGCRDDEKEKWLCKLTRIVNSLKERSVDVGIIELIITDEWIVKVCSYLCRDEQSFNVINNEQGFIAFQYFIHEVFEIKFLESIGLNPFDRDNLNKNHKANYNWCHAKALEAEYLFLTMFAESFGYSISFGTIFEKHPFFSTEERQQSKENDREKLHKIGININSIQSELKDAEEFFCKMEDL